MLAKRYGELKALEKCEYSFRGFVKEAWKVVEPGTPYLPGWHIDAICDHLEALAKREIRNLIINISPRSAKSSLVSVMFPAWRWIVAPEEKFLTASYSSSLSIRDSRKCRNLIKSDWYQKAWGSRFAISKDQNEKGRFENDKGGYRLATSVDGTNIGEGGSVAIYDDPNDLSTIDSPVMRQNTLDWYDGVMSSRSIDPMTDVRLCVQQRGHMDDMTAHLLSFGDWELLTIPMEYEGPSKPTSIGWMDPRTEFGELMHPERFGPKEIAKLKQVQGPHRYAGQFQQRPSAAAGGQLKREYWNYWNPANTDTDKVKIKIGNETIEKTPVKLPAAFEQVCQSWDFAFKDAEHNDFVAGHAWGRVGANIYLLGREHGHFDFPKSIRAIRKMSVDYPCPEKLVEDKANGPAVIATLRNEIPGLIAVTPDGGKESRVNAISGYAEAGNIHLPNPNLYPWVKDLIDEFANFPVSVHDDDTDAMTQAARRLFDSAVNTGVPEFRVMPRMGEPETASHIERDEQMLPALAPQWRRWIAVAPGTSGAALWICETPTKSLRVYRELDLSGADAHEAGRRIGEASLSDVRAYLASVHLSAKWNIDVLLEKEAFTPVEPIGSYAELLEQGILSFDPTKGSWDERQAGSTDLRHAKFSAQMAETDESAFERLRDLLRFRPADYEELDYDRKKAHELARVDINLYQAYMAAVEGRIPGEFPKIKFASSCARTIAALGAVRRDDEKSADEFMRALLIGISAPPSVMTQRAPREIPWNARNQAKFSRRRAG